jgi:hypothetical protein
MKSSKKNRQQRPEKLDFSPSAEELSLHAEFLKSIKSPLWLEEQ